MPSRSFILDKYPRLVTVLVSLLMFGVFLVGLELLFRTVRYVVKGPYSATEYNTYDAELGWHLNTKRSRLVTANKCGEKVVIEPPAHPYLIKTPKYHNSTRVLFIGDSFTAAHQVSTGSAYYDVFERLNKEKYSVYAAGVGGFGYLQEYLLLKKVYDAIRPDIVIWQLSSNDVSDSIYALDNSSFYNNQRPRPYLNLETGEVYFDDPGFFLFDISYGFRFMFYKLLAIDLTHQLGLLEAANTLIALPEDELSKSVRLGQEVLRTVLLLALQEYRQTRFFGFSVGERHEEGDYRGRYEKEYRRIFEKSGAVYFPEVGRIIRQRPLRTDCKPLDPHWNHDGHEVAGTLLTDMLSMALLPGIH